MKITIIGAAGTLGSCAAFEICHHGLVDEMVLVDVQQDMLISHTVDLTTAMAGKDVVVRSGIDGDMSGSDIIIITASAPRGSYSSRMDALTRNLSVVQGVAEKVKRFCPDAVVITATNPIDPINYAVYLCTGLDRKKVIGYSLNDSIRFRIEVAKVLGVKTSRVDGMVIGEHGDSQVLLFSSIMMGGNPAFINDETKLNLRQQIPGMLKASGALKAGRMPGWTSAVGISAMVRAIIEDRCQVIPCSVVLQGEYGCNHLSMAVPVVLGKNGVKKILDLGLTNDERRDLERSINVLKPAMKNAERFLGTIPR